MWIASQLGFYSIVQKDGFFHVRGRLRGDLENLRLAASLEQEIERWPAADYRWRMRVDFEGLGKVFRALERSVDYPNFKSRIHERPDQASKAGIYTRLWTGLYQLQDDQAEGSLQTRLNPPAGARKSSQTFANMASQAAFVPKPAALRNRRRK